MSKKRFHYDWKTGRMKDIQSNSQATKDMRVLETIINDACYSYEKRIKELEEENEQLKQLLDLFASDICEVTELLDDNNIEYELYNDVENFIVKWGIMIE